MEGSKYTLALCLLLIGYSYAAKDGKWPNSNTMSRENGETHVDVRPSDTIDIDDDRKGSYDEWEGSADGQDDESSGWNGEDDEDGEGSADTVSPCQRLRDELNGKKLIGAYIPRCTTVGEFEAMQCHGSTGECWCVNRVGQQIPGTMRRAPEMPNCNNIDRETEFPQAPIDRNPGYQNPDDRDNTETDRPGPPTDGGDGLVIDPPSPDPPNKVDPDNGVEIIDNNNNNENEVDGQDQVRKTKGPERSTIIEQPGILAGIIGGAVVGLLCAVLLVMFIVYRMRKKDEGSYALDEPKRSPSISYSRARDKEFFA